MPNAGAFAATARPIRPAPDDPQLLAAQLRPEHEIQRPALPAAGAHEPVALGDPPRDAEDQRPGELGDRTR